MGQDLALLVDRFRDGALDAAERSALAGRLRAEPQLAERFFSETRFAGQLMAALRQPSDALWQRIDDALAIAGDGHLAQRVLERLPPPSPRGARGHWHRRAWLGAAATIMILISIGVSALPAPPPSGRITVAVLDERSGPGSVSGVPTTLPLACDNDHHAELAFSDGSQVEVGAGSSVALASHDIRGARLELSNGSIQVVVAKQQAGVHFVVQTHEAILTALGTRFTALRFPWGTRLEVSEGRVLVHQLIDDAEAEIPAGMRIDIRKRARELLAPVPLNRPLPAGAEVREPVADAIVVAGRYAHENRGTCLSHILTSPDAPIDERREFFLRFDLTGVHRPVSSAYLQLHINQLTHPGMRLEVARMADAQWRELSITWATRPEIGSTVGDWRPGPDDAPVDLTAAVNAAGELLSLRIRASEGTPPHAVVGFSTREAIPHKRPRLVLVPGHPSL